MSLQDLLILIGWTALFAAAGTLYHHRVAVGGWLRFVMSRGGGAEKNADQVVYRPVDATSMEPHTTPAEQSGMDPTNTTDSADMEAPDAGMDWQPPRISRYLTDDEFIVFLATQKLRNGKYRMSANDIVKASGGDRNHVLAVVRQVREGPTGQYPRRTPDQEAAREALGLVKR